MRLCKSLERNVNRIPCPSQIGGASFGGPTNRQRMTPVPAHHTRFDESFEARSYDNVAQQTTSCSVTSRSKPLFRRDVTGVDILSDSSGLSHESIHVVFEDMEKLSESFREHHQQQQQHHRLEEEMLTQGQNSTAAIPISMTTPGQLTVAFRNLATSPVMHASFARSAPVPVPKHPLSGASVSRAPVGETEKFVPPHILADRLCNCDPVRKEISGGCRGLSSLRARNAVLAQLGYFDGCTDGSPSLPPETSEPKHSPSYFDQDW